MGRARTHAQEPPASAAPTETASGAMAKASCRARVDAGKGRVLGLSRVETTHTAAPRAWCACRGEATCKQAGVLGSGWGSKALCLSCFWYPLCLVALWGFPAHTPSHASAVHLGQGNPAGAQQLGLGKGRDSPVVDVGEVEAMS